MFPFFLLYKILFSLFQLPQSIPASSFYQSILKILTGIPETFTPDQLRWQVIKYIATNAETLLVTIDFPTKCWSKLLS